MILLLIGFFDLFLFPDNILHDARFNPAFLREERVEVMLSSELRYELSDLRTFGLHAQVKRYGMKAASFGNDLYRENVLEIGVGFPVAPGLGVGFSVTGMNCWIRDVANEFTYAVKMGGHFDAGLFSVSGWVNNVNIPRISSIDCAPASYAVCFGYRAHERLSITLAVNGTSTETPFYAVRASFTPLKIMRFAAGVSTAPILLEYGMTVTLGRMFLNYAGSVNEGRGSVEIADAGAYRLLDACEKRREMLLEGKVVTGRFALSQIAGDNWELSLLSS